MSQRVEPLFRVLVLQQGVWPHNKRGLETFYFLSF